MALSQRVTGLGLVTPTLSNPSDPILRGFLFKIDFLENRSEKDDFLAFCQIKQ
jgi:hypothetical protein